MKISILVVVALANLAAVVCLVNPWFADWRAQGAVFLVLEALFLLILGVPTFLRQLGKGRSPREALAESLDSVMSFLTGWV